MDELHFYERTFRVLSVPNVDQNTEVLMFCNPTDGPTTHGDLIISITRYGGYGSPNVTVDTHHHGIHLEVLAQVIDYARRRHGMPEPPSQTPTDSA